MSDIDGKKDEVTGQPDALIKEVTLNDVLQFLDHIDATRHCWFCGRSQLAPAAHLKRDPGAKGLIADHGRPAFVFEPVQNDVEHEQEVRVPMFVMGCQSCGFNYRINAGPMLKWVRDRKNDE